MVSRRRRGAGLRRQVLRFGLEGLPDPPPLLTQADRAVPAPGADSETPASPSLRIQQGAQPRRTLMMRYVVCFLALAASLLPWAARGEDEPETPPPTVITIRPAASPVPALKYSLLPERREQIPGNAAIFYHRAIERPDRGPVPPAAPAADEGQDLAQTVAAEEEAVTRLAHSAAGDASPRGRQETPGKPRVQSARSRAGGPPRVLRLGVPAPRRGIQPDPRRHAGDAGAGPPAGPQDAAGNCRGTDRFGDPLAPDRTGRWADTSTRSNTLIQMLISAAITSRWPCRSRT